MNNSQIDFPALLQKLNQLDQQTVDLSSNHTKDAYRDYLNIWEIPNKADFLREPIYVNKLRELAKGVEIRTIRPAGGARRWLETIADEIIITHRPEPTSSEMFFHFGKMRLNALLPKLISNEVKFFDSARMKNILQPTKKEDKMDLQETPGIPSLVVKNNEEVWDIINKHVTTSVATDESNDQVLLEFNRPSAVADRNAAIDVLSQVDAWPEGYKPEKKV